MSDDDLVVYCSRPRRPGDLDMYNHLIRNNVSFNNEQRTSLRAPQKMMLHPSTQVLEASGQLLSLSTIDSAATTSSPVNVLKPIENGSWSKTLRALALVVEVYRPSLQPTNLSCSTVPQYLSTFVPSYLSPYLVKHYSESLCLSWYLHHAFTLLCLLQLVRHHSHLARSSPKLLQTITIPSRHQKQVQRITSSRVQSYARVTSYPYFHFCNCSLNPLACCWPPHTPLSGLP